MNQAASLVDPNVKIPNAVKAAAARASAIHSEAYNTQPEPPLVPDANAPVTQIKMEGAAQQATQATPAPVQAHVPEQAPAGQDSWENRYKSIKGRFDQQQGTIDGLMGSVSSLQETVRQLSSQPAPPYQPAELQAESFITPQEIQDYGPDFLDVVGRKAREIASAENAELRAKLDRLENAVGNVSQNVLVNDREKLLASLDERFGKDHWRAVNKDPRFKTWLALRDPFSGGIRHDLLTAAYTQNDTLRVAAFFQGFLSEEAAVDPAQGHQAAQLPGAAAPLSLESLAAPGRAKTVATAPVGSTEKPIIQRIAITQFYSDVRAGKYRGREADQKAHEEAIFDAQREGRIR